MVGITCGPLGIKSVRRAEPLGGWPAKGHHYVARLFNGCHEITGMLQEGELTRQLAKDRGKVASDGDKAARDCQK